MVVGTGETLNIGPLLAVPMPVCPIEYRYGSKAMKAVWSEEARFRHSVNVEVELAAAQAALGIVPEEAAAAIRAAAPQVTLERAKAIETEIKHDVMAIVKALAEVAGDAGGHLHRGATSNDIVDTTTGLQFAAALHIIEDDLVQLHEALVALAQRERDTIMLGRTHGQAAVPITYGLKIAVFAAEVRRHIERLREARPRIAVGKLLGATGTGAALGPQALEIQAKVMAALGIGSEEAPTQLVGRDRYVEFVALLATIAATVERMCTEVRNLQRTEIAEVEEYFDDQKQVGSSTMAHKRNPMLSENASGLARIVRAQLTPQLESNILWHERDLSNSSVERFTLTHGAVLCDDILRKVTNVYSNLRVHRETMLANLMASRDLVMAESLMITLVAEGWSRQEAHEQVRQATMQMLEKGSDLKAEFLTQSKLSEEAWDKAMEPRNYTGVSGAIIDRVVADKP